MFHSLLNFLAHIAVYLDLKVLREQIFVLRIPKSMFRHNQKPYPSIERALQKKLLLLDNFFHLTSIFQNEDTFKRLIRTTLSY